MGFRRTLETTLARITVAVLLALPLGQVVRADDAAKEKPTSGMKDDPLLKRVQEYGRAGRLKEADQLLSEALKTSPDRAELYEWRAEVRLMLGDPLLARNDLDAAIAKGRKTGVVFRNRAAANCRLGQFDRALEDVQRAIELAPDITEFRLLRAKVYYQLRDFDKCIADASAYIAADPKKAETFLIRGVAYFQIGKLDEAKADLDATIRLDSHSADAYFNRGLLHGKRGDHRDAIRDFTRSMELQGETAETLRERGRAYYSVGSTAEATADLTAAVRLEPDHVACRIELAGLLFSGGRLYEAFFHADKAVRLAPSNRRAFEVRGRTLAALGDRDRAAEDFSAAIRLDPKDPDLLALRATARLDSDPRAALEDVGRALAIDPAQPRALAVRGNWRLRNQEWEKGCADIQRAIDLGFSDSETLANLAICYAASPVDSMRDGKKALRYAKQASQLASRESPTIVTALALALGAVGEYDEAIKAAAKAKALIRRQRGNAEYLDDMIEQFKERKPYHMSPKGWPPADRKG